MRKISAASELSASLKSYIIAGKSIGFVPTMGALHRGHQSLIQRSVEENEVTVVSIFVNPLQFNNAEDLKKYPRVLEEDVLLLNDQKVDILFCPNESELFPTQPIISVDFGYLAQSLEGKYRSGHFEGVGVIVSKLLHIVQPDRAYFGLKDLQQFILIRTMCVDLNFPTEIIGVETVREESGLALSSRNRRLSSHGLNSATVIFSGLQLIKNGVKKGIPLKSLLVEAEALYNEKKEFELEYIEAVNAENLKPIDDYDELNELAVCVAGYVEGVRLIDNLYLRLK
ncbi:pantothenate synthetase [Ekhidna lutea]|uniref:Pantothenate synthetase n=1 Tax=Ekhidna lutea TaxID=447679 RepID=A0A239KNJ3_EKHLU|nr:pantoate--beta-alanine ligase [Ekhidna lutea]SNT19741.1 pantothenate synthetase [Ekhidna lutea]